MKNRDDLASTSSTLTLDEWSAELRGRDEQTEQALSAIRALAAVLARQAAKDDDDMERKAEGSAPMPRVSPDATAQSGRG